MTVGERIKQLRKQQNMSADDLAIKIGKDRSTIYRYESREIEDMPTSVLEPLAKALNSTPSYLMGWENDFEVIDTPLTSHEKKVIASYRAKPDMQPAVDRLLGVDEESELIPSLVAARSKNNDEPIHIENEPDYSKAPADNTKI